MIFFLWWTSERTHTHMSIHFGKRKKSQVHILLSNSETKERMWNVCVFSFSIVAQIIARFEGWGHYQTIRLSKDGINVQMKRQKIRSCTLLVSNMCFNVVFNIFLLTKQSQWLFFFFKRKKIHWLANFLALVQNEISKCLLVVDVPRMDMK